MYVCQPQEQNETPFRLVPMSQCEWKMAAMKQNRTGVCSMCVCARVCVHVRVCLLSFKGQNFNNIIQISGVYCNLHCK